MTRAIAVAALAAVAVAALGAQAPAAATAKVVGGTPVAAADFPAQVSVQGDRGRHVCGGTLIDPQWVLTAGHCLAFAGRPEVVVGTTRLDGGGLRLASDGTFTPPDYDATRDFSFHDVGLVHLAQPAPAPTARLAHPAVIDLVEAPGTPATVTGWGSVVARRPGDPNGSRSDDLLAAEVPVLDDGACQTALAAWNDVLSDPPTQVCAGSGTAESTEGEADACQGDSGGPLWVRGGDGAHRQVGLVSGGPTCGFSPTYYTSVAAMMGFIESTTGVQFASFVDTAGDQHEGSIERVAFVALAGGFPDGTYRPADGVSRGQLASFVARALGLAPREDGPFPDVDGTTHEDAINAVAAAGIVQGFADGTYRPGELVTRGQLATFLARALDLDPVDGDRFSDIAASRHRTDINAVAVAGLAGGFPDGTYRPDLGVSRGQLATFLANAFV